MFCAVADSDSVLTEIPLLLNSCFNPLINSVLSFSTAVASNIDLINKGVVEYLLFFGRERDNHADIVFFGKGCQRFHML